jgi:hypothetical protein
MPINRADLHRFALPLENYANGSFSGRQAWQEILSQAWYLYRLVVKDLTGYWLP